MYGYVKNNSVNKVDWYGLCPSLECYEKLAICVKRVTFNYLKDVPKDILISASACIGIATLACIPTTIGYGYCFTLYLSGCAPIMSAFIEVLNVGMLYYDFEDCKRRFEECEKKRCQKLKELL